MKNCPYCQHELAEDADLCPACGRGKVAAVRAAKAAGTQYSNRGSKTFSQRVIEVFRPIAVFIVILVWGGGIQGLLDFYQRGNIAGMLGDLTGIVVMAAIFELAYRGVESWRTRKTTKARDQGK